MEDGEIGRTPFDVTVTLLSLTLRVGNAIGCAVGVIVWLPNTMIGAFAEAPWKGALDPGEAEDCSIKPRLVTERDIA